MVTTPEMSSTKRFDQETGLIGLKTVKKKLFLHQMVPEAVVGQITGSELIHFESATATQVALNDSGEYGYQFSSHQNCPHIGFGRYSSETTPTALDFPRFHYILAVSQVDCCHYRMETVTTVPPGVSGYVDNCGIDDITPADCEGMTSKAVVHNGIFENPFAEETTKAEPESLV
jgi:hypothetical protein